MSAASPFLNWSARRLWMLIAGLVAVLTIAAAWLLHRSGAGPAAVGLIACGGFATIMAVVGLGYFLGAKLLALERSAMRSLAGDVKAAAPPGIAELNSVARAVVELSNKCRQQAQSLVSLRNEQQAILQSMDGGVIALDSEQRILSMNRAAEWMLSLTDSSARGRLLQEVARQPDLNRFITDALAGRAEEGEFVLQGPPSRRVHATHSHLNDADGKPVGLLVVLSDITQLRRLESVRSDFAANVSHELRTPITNIKGYIETLLDMDIVLERDQAERFLRIIGRNADRLSAIVEDMLTLTQLERPDMKEDLAREKTRIATLAESVEQALEKEAAAKSINILREVPDDLLAEINPQLVEQAITNLVFNAIKYCPNGTRVWVRGAMVPVEGREYAEIEIVDEGPGIGEEHLARIFERFYRVDKARSREQGGTGLGLAIVKHIVQLHGGRIEVDSALGRGSTFRMLLPAA